MACSLLFELLSLSSCFHKNGLCHGYEKRQHQAKVHFCLLISPCRCSFIRPGSIFAVDDKLKLGTLSRVKKSTGEGVSQDLRDVVACTTFYLIGESSYLLHGISTIISPEFHALLSSIAATPRVATADHTMSCLARVGTFFSETFPDQAMDSFLSGLSAVVGEANYIPSPLSEAMLVGPAIPSFGMAILRSLSILHQSDVLFSSPARLVLLRTSKVRCCKDRASFRSISLRR